MDFNAFLESLPIMGKGLLGIFVVIIVISFVIMALNKLTASKKKPNNQ